MLRKLVAVVALGLIPISASAVAHAEPVSSQTLIDERGDIWRIPGEGRPVAAPHQHRGDIRRTIIRHGKHAVTVRAKFGELTRNPQGHVLVVGLRTNTGVLRAVSLIAGQYVQRSGWRGIVTVERRDGRPVKCTTAHRINYTTNVMGLRVPRSCINTPRSVQAKAFYIGMHGKGGQASEFFDNAHNPGSRMNGWTRRLSHP